MGNTNTHFGIYRINPRSRPEETINCDGSTKNKSIVRTECEEILRRRVTPFPSEESSIRTPPQIIKSSQQAYLNTFSSNSFGCSPMISSPRHYTRQPTGMGHTNPILSVDRYNLTNYATTIPRLYDDYRLKYSPYNYSDFGKSRPFYGGTNNYPQTRSYNHDPNPNYNCNSSYNYNRTQYTIPPFNNNYFLSNPYAEYIGGGGNQFYRAPIPVPQYQQPYNNHQYYSPDSTDTSCYTNAVNEPFKYQQPYYETTNKPIGGNQIINSSEIADKKTTNEKPNFAVKEGPNIPTGPLAPPENTPGSTSISINENPNTNPNDKDAKGNPNLSMDVPSDKPSQKEPNMPNNKVTEKPTNGQPDVDVVHEKVFKPQIESSIEESHQITGPPANTSSTPPNPLTSTPGPNPENGTDGPLISNTSKPTDVNATIQDDSKKQVISPESNNPPDSLPSNKNPKFLTVVVDPDSKPKTGVKKTSQDNSNQTDGNPIPVKRGTIPTTLKPASSPENKPNLPSSLTKNPGPKPEEGTNGPRILNSENNYQQDSANRNKSKNVTIKADPESEPIKKPGEEKPIASKSNKAISQKGSSNIPIPAKGSPENLTPGAETSTGETEEPVKITTNIPKKPHKPCPRKKKKEEEKGENKDTENHENKDGVSHENKDKRKHENKDGGNHENKDRGKHEDKDEGKHENKDGGKHEKKDEGKHENKDGGKHDNKDGGKHDNKDGGKHEKQGEKKNDKKDDKKR